jgi:hypothetical protein
MTPRTPALRFALVAVHLVIAVLVWNQTTNSNERGYDRISDPARYRAIATTPGTPYEDFEAEYPPVALAIFKGLGTGTFDGFLKRLLLTNMLLNALVALLLFKQWGRPAGFAYLALSAPLMPIVYTRFDLFVVAFSVAGASMVKRGRAPLGALCWAFASFVKVWPAALLGRLAARNNVRAFATGIAAGAAGVAGWIAWVGTDGLRQVLTYRGADGWHFESVPGTVLRAVTRADLVNEAGTWRVGSPPPAPGVLLTIAMLAVVGWVWATAYRTNAPEGLAEVAVITTLLVFGTLCSPQFFIWLVPFVAIAAAAGERKVFGLTAAVVALTLTEWAVFDPDAPGAFTTEALVFARNVALVCLLLLGLRSVAAARENGAWSPAPSPEASPTHPAPISSSTPKGG